MIATHSDRPVTQDTCRDFLSALFSVLAQKYQFERRIDIFLTMFLPEIFYELFGWQVALAAPEFPLKKDSNNQSTNVDHLLFRRAERVDDERWLFFELKTDRFSVRDDQIEIYRRAMQRGMPALFQELAAIRTATQARHGQKYDLLVQRLAPFPLNRPIELVYFHRARSPFFSAHPESPLCLPDFSSSTLTAAAPTRFCNTRQPRTISLRNTSCHLNSGQACIPLAPIFSELFTLLFVNPALTGVGCV